MIIRASNGMAFGRTFDIPEAGEALSWNKKRKSWITYVPPSTAAAEVYPDATRRAYNFIRRSDELTRSQPSAQSA